MNAKPPLRILALLEADSISGTAKAVLEMAYEAKADVSSQGEVQISVANFARGRGSVDNALTTALSAAHIPFSFLREKGRFDSSVIQQIRDLARHYDSNLIWTNSIKSHFLVNKAAVKSCRWVAFHHGYTSTDFKMRIYNQLDRLSLRNADRVLTVCRPFADQMEARGVRVSRIRIQHMPIRPFQTSAEDGDLLRKELDLPVDTKVILSVGRLSQEKGHSDLIKAFSLLQEETNGDALRLVLVGDGPERASLAKQAAETRVPGQIVFAGHRDDAKRFYGIASVFALPSYTEGTPNVLLEAMAARLPLVATSVGGIPELVVDGESGRLVPPSDPPSLSNALTEILKTAGLRQKLASGGWRVVEAHSPRSYFESMREVFSETAAR